MEPITFLSEKMTHLQMSNEYRITVLLHGFLLPPNVQRINRQEGKYKEKVLGNSDHISRDMEEIEDHPRISYVLERNEIREKQLVKTNIRRNSRKPRAHKNVTYSLRLNQQQPCFSCLCLVKSGSCAGMVVPYKTYCENLDCLS